jgi:heat shock protein HtpX
MYKAISQNKVKSYLILVFFFIFLSFVLFVLGRAMGYSGPSLFLFAFLISLFSSFFSYYFSDKIVLALHSAKPANREEHYNFYTVAENLAIGAGMPKPRLYVINDQSPNAFATGRNPKNAIIVATTGLLNLLDRRELEGVVAHELSHIKNYDILLMTIASVLVGFVVYLTDFFMRSIWFSRRDNDRKGSGVTMIIAIAAAVLSPIVATLLQLALSRKREYLADASGAYLTRYPQALASALEKISSQPTPLKSASNATAHMFIENPFKADVKKQVSWYAKLFSTHPPVQERIQKLRAM